MDTPAPAFRPEPAVGRVYSTRRLVRSTDVTPDGRLRLDALARYLQNVAEDDLADSGLLTSILWLVRRCSMTISDMPRMGERISLRTFCSGNGPRWAERTTTVAGPDGPAVQATAVWAAVDPESGRPVAPGKDFMAVYGPSAQGNVVSARLSHPRAPGEVAGRAWPLRAADFDTAGHVNNAVTWAAVEDVLAGAVSPETGFAETGFAETGFPGTGFPGTGFAGTGRLPGHAEVEYHRAILPGCQPVLATGGERGEPMMWLLDGGRLLASARLSMGTA
jgi:acyl-ACP thioesterase